MQPLNAMDYDAFISYRRSDGSRTAQWLRKELESYRPPKKLQMAAGKRLRIYLDTAYERGTEDFYEQSIRPALLAAHYLIVIATPDAVARPQGTSDWIQREVHDFAETPQYRNVLVVRGAGDASVPLPADLNQRFPNAEIILRGASLWTRLTPMLSGRLAHEKLKLVAPLLGIPPNQMPALRMEEERRQQLRIGATVGTTFTVLALVAVTAVIAFNSLWTARDALKSSIFTIEQMISSIADQLPVDDQVGGARSSLLNQACDLIDMLAAEAPRPPEIRERVLCALERAHGREMQGEFTLAESTLVSAVRLALEAERQTPSPAAAHALLQARSGLVDLLLRRSQIVRARGEIVELLRDANHLTMRYPDDPGLRIAAAEAYALHATQLTEKEQAEARSDALVQAARNLEEAAASVVMDPIRKPELQAWQAELLALAATANMERHHDAVGIRQLREAAALRMNLRWTGADAKTKDVANQVILAELHVAIAAAEASRGQLRAAHEARDLAMRYLAAASQSPDAPAQVLDYARAVRGKLAALGNYTRQ